MAIMDKYNHSKKLAWMVSRRSIFYCIMLLLYFRPAQYVFGTVIYTIGNYALLGEFFIMVLICFINYNRNNYRISKAARYFFILFFWCTAGSTVFNWIKGTSVSFSDAIVFFSTAAGFILLIDFGLTKEPQRFLKCFVAVGTLMCLINALTIFIYSGSGGMNYTAIVSGGHQTYYFLAEDNASVFWTWPVMIVTWIYFFRYCRTKKMGIWAVFYTVITFISYYYVWSVTAMCSVMLMAFVVFYFRKAGKKEKNRRKIIGTLLCKFDIYWISALIVNYIVAVSQTWTKYAELLTIYFNKSMTASGRTFIWEKSVEWINKSLLIGYGQELRDATISKILINHTHNILLETFYRGGMVGGLIFLFAIFCLSKISRGINNRIYDFLMISIFVFFLMCSIDFAFYRYVFLILFILMGHSEIFQKNIEKLW